MDKVVPRVLGSIVFAGLVSSCATNHGNGNVTGNDATTTFVASSAFLTGGPPGLLLDSSGDACNTQNAVVPSSKLLAIRSIVDVGTFAIESADFQVVDAKCGLTTALQSTTGTITFASVEGATTGNPTSATGTFDVTFGSEHLVGSFAAVRCSVVNTDTDSAVRCL